MLSRLSFTVAAILAFCALQAPVAAAAGPWSLFDSSTTITDAAADDPGPVEVGVQFSVAAPTGGDYWVDAIRFYRPSHGMVSNSVSLFDAGGNLVGHGNATYEGPYTGMVDVSLQSPVKLTPGATYTASYSADGYYVEQQHGFDAPRTVGPVTFPAGAGVYSYDGGFPTDSWADDNYYVTPIVSLRAATPPPDVGPWSLLAPNAAPADAAADDPDLVEVGAKFKVSAPASGDYWVDAVRFWRPTHGMVSNTVRIYDNHGVVVGYGNATGEGGRTGLIDVLLWNGGLRLTPGVTYTATYLAEGYYAEHQKGFKSARTAGPIAFPANAGVYRYGGGFPTGSWQSTDYDVSPVVSLRSRPAVDNTVPVVTITSHANGDRVTANAPFTLTATIADPAGPITSARLLVNWVPQGTVANPVNGGTVSFPLTVAMGQSVVRVEATDAAGNVGQTAITLNGGMPG
ncbi:MAG TPA: DUF4082 domain-containing protein [Solirubrobacteraceae bacterium]|jgi:hypothetical protein